MYEYRHGLHDLLCRVGQSDENAFIQMYENLHRIAVVTILGEFSNIDEFEAEAIYNQAMFKIWKRASTFEGRPGHDPDVTAWAWIRITILHTAQDVTRVMRRRGFAEILEAEMMTEEERGGSTELSPIDRLSISDLALSDQPLNSPAALVEGHEGLVEFIQSLDERERTIFRMLAEGVSQAEIAAKLGISPSRMSQIVHSLRSKAEKILRP
jgi:RNA polymerase sigma factor (sigma-70 family)